MPHSESLYLQDLRVSLSKDFERNGLPCDPVELAVSALRVVNPESQAFMGRLLSSVGMLGLDLQELRDHPEFPQGLVGKYLSKVPNKDYEALDLALFLNAYHRQLPDVNHDLGHVCITLEGQKFVKLFAEITMGHTPFDKRGIRLRAMKNYCSLAWEDLILELEGMGECLNLLRNKPSPLPAVLKKVRSQLHCEDITMTDLFPKTSNPCSPDRLQERYNDLMLLEQQVRRLNIMASLLGGENWDEFRTHPSVTLVKGEARELIKDYERTPCPNSRQKEAWPPRLLILEGLLMACDKPFPLERVTEKFGRWSLD
ncbi:MAG: hypothetical protein ACI9QC_000655 [Oceanicoccus sp.]|jgi:hypothetical protein